MNNRPTNNLNNNENSISENSSRETSLTSSSLIKARFRLLGGESFKSKNVEIEEFEKPKLKLNEEKKQANAAPSNQPPKAPQLKSKHADSFLLPNFKLTNAPLLGPATRALGLPKVSSMTLDTSESYIPNASNDSNKATENNTTYKKS